MLFDITPRNIVLDNQIYMVEGYSVHNHIRYAKAYRRHYWSMIEVEDNDIRMKLGEKLC